MSTSTKLSPLGTGAAAPATALWGAFPARWRLTPALKLRASRLSLGAALAAHFASQVVLAAWSHGEAPLHDAHFVEQIAGVGLPWGKLFSELPPAGRAAWFLCAASLSVLVALGWRARLCAALLLAVSVEAYWGAYAGTVLDDRVANLMALWLALLPTERPTTSGSALRVYGGQLLLFALLSSLVLTSQREVDGAPLGAGLLLIAGALLAPGAAARSVAMALVLLLHLAFYASTGLVFTSAAFCSVALILLWPGRAGASEQRPVLVDGGAVLGSIFGALLLACLAASMAGWTLTWNVARRALSDLGAVPEAARVLDVSRVRGISVQADSGATARLTLPAVSLGRRDRALAAVLVSPAAMSSLELRADAARHFAERFCAAKGDEAMTGHITVQTRSEPVRAAWFACSARTAPEIVLLD